MIDFIVGGVPLLIAHGVECGLHHCENKTTNCFSNSEWFEPYTTRCNNGWKFDSFSVVPVCPDCLEMLENDAGEVFRKAREVFGLE